MILLHPYCTIWIWCDLGFEDEESRAYEFAASSENEMLRWIRAIRNARYKICMYVCMYVCTYVRSMYMCIFNIIIISLLLLIILII